MEAVSTDPTAYRGLLASQPRAIERFGIATARLVAAIQSSYALATGSLKPADKVAHLQDAKNGLQVLLDLTAKTPGFEVVGAEEAARAIAELEATFAAFGWMGARQ